MSLHLTLLCHAATAATRAAAFPADAPLDPTALRKLAARPVRLGRADVCWTSPALCARQTAEAMGLPATVEPALRECDYAAWSGRTLDDLQAEQPTAVMRWLTDPDAAPHGGESVTALLDRAGRWLDGLEGSTGRAVAITHPAMLRAVIVHALSAPPAAFWRITTAPLSVAVLQGRPARWTLVSLGQTGQDAG